MKKPLVTTTEPPKKRFEGRIFAIDFDGTCVTHEFPKVGQEIGASSVLKRIVEEGGKLVLWTMRSDYRMTDKARNGKKMTSMNPLADAVKWFQVHDIPLFAVNSNPEQGAWTSSPKAYAHTYIDDAALGAPLMSVPSMSERPFIDWKRVAAMLFNDGPTP